MYVIKRNGVREEMSFGKVQDRFRKMCKTLNLTCNASLMAHHTIREMADGIYTPAIDEISQRVALSMKVQNPEYSILAAAILVSSIHKDTANTFSAAMRRAAEYLDPAVLSLIQMHSGILDAAIYNRDYTLDYETLAEMKKSLLIRGANGSILERPQYLYMRVAIAMHLNTLDSIFIDEVLRTYDQLSRRRMIISSEFLMHAGLKRARGCDEDAILPVTGRESCVRAYGADEIRRMLAGGGHRTVILSLWDSATIDFLMDIHRYYPKDSMHICISIPDKFMETTGTWNPLTSTDAMKMDMHRGQSPSEVTHAGSPVAPSMIMSKIQELHRLEENTLIVFGDRSREVESFGISGDTSEMYDGGDIPRGWVNVGAFAVGEPEEIIRAIYRSTKILAGVLDDMVEVDGDGERVIKIHVHGLGDFFHKMSIRFNTEQATRWNLDIFEAIAFAMCEVSVDRAARYGITYTDYKSQFPNGGSGTACDWEDLKIRAKKVGGLRNRFSIGVTKEGSSAMFMGCSLGAEPFSVLVDGTKQNEIGREVILRMAADRLPYLIGSNQAISIYVEETLVPGELESITREAWRLKLKRVPTVCIGNVQYPHVPYIACGDSREPTFVI